jgi:CyaY protein
MLDEQEFRRVAEAALDALMQHLMAREAEAGAGFEVEQEGGVLYVLFEEPAARFVITSNAPVRQIWISALITSFKLEWDQATSAFILPGTGEQLTPLIDRLIGKQLEG